MNYEFFYIVDMLENTNTKKVMIIKYKKIIYAHFVYDTMQLRGI